jgi:magnesium transporter
MTSTPRERKIRFGTAGLLGPAIEDLIHSAPGELADATEDIHPADLAEITEDLEPEDRVVFLNHLATDQAAEVIGDLDPALLKDAVHSLAPSRAAVVLRLMTPDDRADAVGSLDREEAESLLARLSRADREETRRLLAYPDVSAGGLMTPDFVSLRQDETVAGVIERVKGAAPEVETIYALYVVDEAGRLIGTLSLRDLLTASPEASIGEVMRDDFLSASVETDQEEVANLISKYDLLALPVVDAGNRLLGIVTVDDVLDVMVEESTEDVQKMGAVTPLEGGYFQTSFWRVARSRAGWLGILFLGVMFTATVLEFFEETIDGALALVFFLPLIMATGGNSGAQSSTLIIRGIAVGDVEAPDLGRVAIRELFTGLLLGAFLAVIALGRAMWGGQSFGVSMVVALTVVTVVTVGALIGGLLPILIRRVGFDPAVASSPLVTSLIDVVTIVLYFSVARVVLGI